MTEKIVIDSKKIADFCQKHHIKKLSLFGSVLRDDFRSDSDVDVLVEFEPGHVPGFEFVRIKEELSHLMGNHPVDLVTLKFLNHRVRQSILSSAEVKYAA